MADIVTMKDDGTVVLNLTTGRVTLRRPTVGQVRAVQDATIDAGDAGVDLAETSKERMEEAAETLGIDISDPLSEAAAKVLTGWSQLAGAVEDGATRTETLAGWVAEAVETVPDAAADLSAAEARQWRRTQRDENKRVNREMQAVWFEVGRLIVKALAGGSKGDLPDDDDDLDPALGQPSLYTRLLRHWTTVPLS